MKNASVQKRIILCVMVLFTIMISVSLSALDKDNFRILNHSQNQIELKFNLGSWNLESKTENGIEIKSISSSSQNNLYVDETETLPIYSAMIAIPDGMDVELVTDVNRQQNLSNVNLLNSNAMVQGRGASDFYPQNQIVVSEPGQFRDFRVANINVFPFQIDTRSNDLKVIEEANITLRFVPSRGGYVNPSAGFYSRSFQNLYEGLILNFENVRDETVATEQPILLVIYGNSTDTTYLAKVDEYVNWKRQKGYIVNKASTSAGEAGSSTTTIKAYILAQYNNLSTRPDVVTLIGDTNGSFPIPTWSTDYDYGYQMIAGGDMYGDVQLGRISVETTDHLTNYLAKIYAVERDLYLPTAQWLNRIMLTGDPSSSGVSTIFTSKYIKEISEAVNPSYTYTEIYATPFASAMNSAITNGVSIWNYRGYLGMSGWGTDDMALLNNGLKLNHAVIITCGTGTFNGSTSTTESYVRLGTEAVPSGGLTAIGMATSGTHTGLNNCLDVGIFHGIYDMGMRNMGEAILQGKINLHNVYGVSSPSNAQIFAGYCNLIGDPTAEAFIGIPDTFTVTAPASIAVGTTTLQVIAKNASNVPVANAAVNIWQASSSTNLTVYSDENGLAYFTLPGTLTGSLTLTVSKHDFKPTIQTITISGTGGLVYQTSTISGDGIINAGETVSYNLSIKNTTGSTVSGISGTITESDPYVSFSAGTSISFSNAASGSIVVSSPATTIIVDPTCPDYHPVTFTLNLNSSAGSFSIPIQHIVRAADLDYVSHTVMGANSYLEQSETANMYVTVINHGSVNATAVYGVLRSLNNAITVNDSVKYFGNINSGSSYSNSALPFSVSANSVVIDGMIIPMQLYLYNAAGYSDTESFSITIGNTTVTDPVGQDEYGYFIFDTGDTGYGTQCPTYSWVGIAPGEPGGLFTGTALAISDAGSTGDEGDQVGADALETVALPFTFRYYGVAYNQITVCSNGFLVMGTTANHDFRNWRIPGSGGPNAMIAPFWDDLSTMTGGIYTYYDAPNHRYIVEWYNLRNGYNRTSEETFQVILYDPTYYPTATNDGPIKMQYKVFNNVDLTSGVYSHGNACTVGIKDHTGTVGLEYTYNNTYPTAAQPLANQKALYITTAPITPNEPYLWITDSLIMDGNSNGLAEPGETLDIRLTVSNLGTQTANNASVTISESDPWINITGNTASLGNIAGLGNATNNSGLYISVLNGCPNNYEATVDAVITCSGYSFNRSFTITISAPSLSFGNMLIQDPTGNNNGRLDPGETVTLTIPLNNIGASPSASGSATLSSSTPGITVNDGNDTFSAISAGGGAALSFNITASSGMTIGTVATFVFNATAGLYTANKIENTTAGIILENFETGNFNNYPWTFAGDATWMVDNTVSHEGSYSARSGFIAHSQSTTMQTIRILTSPGDLTFWYRISSEANYDYLKFYIDGVQQNQWSGNTDTSWHQVTYPLSAGTRTLTWTYSKDGSVIGGSDAAWVDDIIFPASTAPSVYNPPQNLTASPSNLSVRLDWAAPASGTPLNYKIYKNGGLTAQVSTLYYTDLAVTNGTTYSYYVKAAYAGGDSDATDTVQATPNAIAPTSLSAIGGNGFVNLNWSPATGRQEAVLRSSDSRAISGYKIYRNSSYLTTTTGTTYQDDSVTNELTYSYYVTTLYASPAGESGPSNTAEATPTAMTPTTVILGSGTTATGTSTASPINIYYESLHGQSIYTAAELNAAGVFGPIPILQIGFNVTGVPSEALPSFLIRMKHTSDTNVANWQTADNMETVYGPTSYMPTAGGYDMLILNIPFVWNGTDNIVVDTAFDVVNQWTSSGTVEYTTMTSGYRSVRQDGVNQTNVFVGGTTSSNRPNIQFAMQPQVQLNAPVISIEEQPTGCRISWDAVNGATRYFVFASAESDSGFSQIAEVTGTEYTDTSANNCRFYYVVAADGAAARVNINK